MTTRFAVALAAVLLGLGCTSSKNGGDGPTGDDDDDSTTWASIVSGDWTLGPNSEITADTYSATLDRDYYIGGIRPVSPPGTHHTLLATNPSGFSGIIYASGLGTEELVFPPGVGLHLSEGETLYLQLHLFNVEATELTGTSGIEILEIPEAELVHEADVFLPGPFELDLPPSQTTSAVDTCNITSEMSLFAVIPHMHQMGTHFRMSATASGVTTTLHDDDYSFSSQSVYEFAAPVTVGPGDSLELECTWNNPTGDPVGWGESSETEMCFGITFRWPAQGQEFCTLSPPF